MVIQMKIAAVGFCCIDEYKELGRRYPTGNGVDCVINLAKKGISASVVSAVGNDEYGKEMFEVLKHYGIDASHLHVREGKTSLMEMGLNGNDRVHLYNHRGVMADFALTPEDVAFIKQHEYLHTDYDGRIAPQLQEFRKAGVKVVFDFSVHYQKRENTDAIMKETDYAFLSYERRDSFIEDYLRRAKALGAGIVTATLGENGSLCYDGERFYEQPAIPAEVVNTVGAGDSFVAGFMYGVMQGWDIPRCLYSGTETANAIVQKFEPY